MLITGEGYLLPLPRPSPLTPFVEALAQVAGRFCRGKDLHLERAAKNLQTFVITGLYQVALLPSHRRKTAKVTNKLLVPWKEKNRKKTEVPVRQGTTPLAYNKGSPLPHSHPNAPRATKEVNLHLDLSLTSLPESHRASGHFTGQHNLTAICQFTGHKKNQRA